MYNSGVIKYPRVSLDLLEHSMTIIHFSILIILFGHHLSTIKKMNAQLLFKMALNLNDDLKITIKKIEIEEKGDTRV